MSKEIKLCLVYRDMWQSSGKYMPNADQLVKVASPIIKMGCWDRVETNGGGFEQIQLLAGENPNDVLRKWTMPFNEAGIQTQMLERGLNALSMFPVAKDVRKLMFSVKKKQGTDIARSFDGLNDIRNLRLSIDYAKEAGMISQSCLCITHSKIHTVDYYINLAKKLIDLGTDEIAIKDMAGIGRPSSLGKIVKGIKKYKPNVIIQYHGHSGPGFSVASSLEVARAGADIIDVAMEPLSWGTTHADLLTIHEILKDDGFLIKDYDRKSYMEVKKLTQEFVDEFLGYYINPKNRLMNSLLIDSGLPGGMMGSLMNDLEKSHKSINRWLQKNNKKEISLDNLFAKLLDEVNFIWPILGYPPLVTPYSQYVKNVALVNVLNNIKGKNRWSLIDDNTWDMLLGKSGQLPGKLGDEIIKLSKDLNKTFYNGEPQELVENVLDKNREEMKEKGWELGKDDEELLEYSLHKTQYLEFKSGAAKKKLADDILEKKNNKSEESIPSKIKKEIITIGDSRYEVEYIDEENNSQSIKNPPGKKILSPIEGRVFLTKDSKDTAVKENDIVKKGDIICYIESMKVINAIKSEYSGKILKIYFNEGDDVFDDDILFIIN
ncbi:MAG: oxaloacetate decarboxylase [Cytophagia bacterium]|jgi:pyruvate carboxylase subunit B|nr:oxaloacetate decarboxylase [Cytophagia bacterium]|tara:strand:- start:30 stop:1841 length:1812 start_codon:yes stop_codon:yes gene_type:complete